MPTYFLDLEGGNDALDGLTFANRWRTFTLGATAARLAPGDTIRVMGSPAPTSLGANTATWTDGPLAAAYAIVSSTNATPIVVTLSSANYTAMAPVVGDTLTLYGHTVNTKANGTWWISAAASPNITLVNADGTNSVGNGVGGATGSVRKATNRAVILTTAVTANIACTGNQGTKANWTGATADVVPTVITTDFKEGGECIQIAIAAGFTTGMAAYFATGTLDLSGNQQISFWIKQTSGTIGLVGSTTMRLCSDVAGATVVDTFNIPALGALNQWMPVTIDKGVALGAAIASISIAVVTDNGAQTFLIDNVIGVKAAGLADSLSGTSLIGKNTTGETFYGIQSINGTRILLDQHTNSIPNAASPSRGYSGTTETVTTHKLETIKTAIVATNTTIVSEITDSGTLGNLITFSGGWNRTDMSTQTLDTWLDGTNGFGRGLYSLGRSFYKLDRLRVVRYNTGVEIISGSSNSELSDIHSNNCTANGLLTSNHSSMAIGTMLAMNNAANGINNGSGDNMKIGTITASNNGNGINVAGVVLNANNCAVNTKITTKNNFTTGLDFASGCNNTIKNGDFGASTVRQGDANGGKAGDDNYLFNPTFTGSTAINISAIYTASRLRVDNFNGVAGDDRVYMDVGLMMTEATIRNTPSGVSWSMAPTSTNASATYPLSLPIAVVGFNASTLVTIKLFMRRSNTALTMRLMCKGGQIAGVDADVSSSMTAVADTWEELTITFTPTVAGAVEITAEAYGGTAFTGYVDDFSSSQA